MSLTVSFSKDASEYRFTTFTEKIVTLVEWKVKIGSAEKTCSCDAW